MGRARNKRRNPEHGFYKITSPQLQTRTIVIASKIMGSLLTLGPATIKGPSTMAITPDDDGSLSLNIGWRWRPKDDDERPDMFIRFTPKMTLKTGTLKVEDFYHEACPNKDKLRQQIGDLLVKAQIETTDEVLMSRAKQGEWS